MFQFFKKEKLCTSFIQENQFQRQYVINLTFIWNHLYLFIICIIYLESSAKVFYCNLNYQHISKTINISEVTLSETVFWVPGFPAVLHSFSFFTVMATLEVTSYISILKYFNSICSNSLVPLPFWCHHIKLGNVIKWKSQSDGQPSQ